MLEGLMNPHLRMAVLALCFVFSLQNKIVLGQLTLLNTINMPDVAGRIDHMAFDSKGNRLFIAALANNTVEIVNLKAAKPIGTISGLNAPQGVLYLEEFNSIVISNGGSGAVQSYNGNSLALSWTLDIGEDADNVRYDSVKKQIIVGYGSGALSFFDAKSGRQIKNIPLPGHPESFELESNGKRIFVNVSTGRLGASISNLF